MMRSTSTVVPKRPAAGNLLYTDIRQRILQGELQPGDRLFSTRDMVEHFGLSSHAAVLALRRLTREGFIRRQPGAGTFVTELTNRRAVREKPVKIRVLVTVDEIIRSFFRLLLETLEAQLKALETEFVFVEHPDLRGQQPLAMEGSDVLIWVRPTTKEWKVSAPGLPVVMVAHDVDRIWPVGAGWDVVTADSRVGGAIAGKYLREGGCRNIAILAARYGSSQRPDLLSQLRVEGFEVGWGEEVAGSRILLAETHSYQVGAKMTPEILNLVPAPDAVFATSDDLAGGLCHGLLAHGVRPGKEIKIVGFDGQPARHRGEPVLTTIRVPLEAMAKAAALMALERAAEPDGVARRLLLGCELRKGETG